MIVLYCKDEDKETVLADRRLNGFLKMVGKLGEEVSHLSEHHTVSYKLGILNDLCANRRCSLVLTSYLSSLFENSETTLKLIVSAIESGLIVGNLSSGSMDLGDLRDRLIGRWNVTIKEERSERIKVGQARALSSGKHIGVQKGTKNRLGKFKQIDPEELTHIEHLSKTLSYREIAQKTGLSVATISRRLKKATK